MHKNKWSRYAFMAGCTLVALSIILGSTGCGSRKIVKQYNSDGLPSEIQILVKGVTAYRIFFKYDNNKRVIVVFKSTPNGKDPLMRKKFFYDSRGKLRLQSHYEKTRHKGKKVVDIWVESFFYNRSGILLKTETSFKSSYSIASNRTPLLITRYYYNNTNVERVVINGGTFKKELTLHYKKNKLRKIGYLYLKFHRQKKSYIPGQHVVFTMRRNNPVSAIDKSLQKARSLNKHDMAGIYSRENIDNILKQVSYSRDSMKLAKYLEKTLTH